MKALRSFIIIAMLGLMAVPAQQALSQDTKPAQQAADTWLALVDAERYSEAWKGFSSFFQERMTFDQWQQQIKSARSIFGKLEARKPKLATAAKSLPGAPDGDYVVVQYDTEFDKKEHALETVTMLLGKDGKWGVAGYFIK
jgi:hypothetical protein